MWYFSVLLQAMNIEAEKEVNNIPSFFLARKNGGGLRWLFWGDWLLSLTGGAQKYYLKNTSRFIDLEDFSETNYVFKKSNIQLRYMSSQGISLFLRLLFIMHAVILSQ